MDCLLGLDIGTSSVKALLLEAGTVRVLASVGREYPLHIPRPGTAEQNPDDWWQAAAAATRAALDQSGIEPQQVRAVGFSGQMHGTVCVDAFGEPVRPAIIWADARTRAECDALSAAITPAEMAQHAPGPLVPGFMAATLMWLSHHEPETLRWTHKVLLPKDYVRLRMTGDWATDPTDAAATWLFDMARGEWSEWLLDRCGVDARLMPSLRPPEAAAGALLPDAAAQMGLPAGIPVMVGCADQPAQALGHGVLDPGTMLVTTGTGGQVFLPFDAPRTDPAMRLHVFPHAVPGRWYALAATLSAGLSLRWLRDLLGMAHRPDAYDELSRLAASVPPGAEGLLFLPYLAGERSPVMDSQAGGLFLGLKLHHGPGHMARAVMEGVSFSLAACLSIAVSVGGSGLPHRLIATGGAAQSPVWRQIQADAFNLPLWLASGRDHAAVGAALIAGAGGGFYDSLTDACAGLPAPGEQLHPEPEAAALYAELKQQFDGLYIRLKDDMHRLSALS